MPNTDPTTLDLLRLALTPGFGPVLIGRAIALLGSADAVLSAPESQLRAIKGVGEERAAALRTGLEAGRRAADDELVLADSLGVTLLPITNDAYPPLLRQIPDPPPILYLRGQLLPASDDRYPVAIVGSRTCTAYGMEQAERFAMQLAQAGLTVVSGGARGIDTAAHRAALRVKGRTIAVLGCGLANCYPPDNAALFQQIVGSADESQGCLVSELPLRTAPHADNFPARNRIISGLSLGVLVIEAGKHSGSLITARLAAEDQGREVFVLPGRVDSRSSEGSHELIKKGGAALVTAPSDIIDALESPARHHFNGTHAAITADPARDDAAPFQPPLPVTPASPPPPTLSPSQQAILGALTAPKTLDELARDTGADPGAIRADLTVLEIRRKIRRQGVRVAANA